jgi:hypothetical protein
MTDALDPEALEAWLVDRPYGFAGPLVGLHLTTVVDLHSLLRLVE